jgi:hypothetical protein
MGRTASGRKNFTTYKTICQGELHRQAAQIILPKFVQSVNTNSLLLVLYYNQEKERENKTMTRVKKFFNIETPYKFEYNDLRCLITILNVGLIMAYGLSISWFGLAVAIIGLIKDFATDRHINGILMHFASVALNVYFLTLLYTRG